MAYNKAAQARYNAKSKVISAMLRPTDADILEYLRQIEEPPATMIKRLIRAEMRAKGLPTREESKVAETGRE